MEKIEYEKLVAKIYDAITGASIIIWASIVFGWWWFFLSLVIVWLEEYSNKNHLLSDWTEH